MTFPVSPHPDRRMARHHRGWPCGGAGPHRSLTILRVVWIDPPVEVDPHGPCVAETERREREDWTFEVSLFLRNRFLAHELYDEYYGHAMTRAQWNALVSSSEMATSNSLIVSSAKALTQSALPASGKFGDGVLNLDRTGRGRYRRVVPDLVAHSLVVWGRPRHSRRGAPDR